MKDCAAQRARDLFRVTAEDLKGTRRLFFGKSAEYKDGECEEKSSEDTTPSPLPIPAAAPIDFKVFYSEILTRAAIKPQSQREEEENYPAALVLTKEQEPNEPEEETRKPRAPRRKAAATNFAGLLGQK